MKQQRSPIDPYPPWFECTIDGVDIVKYIVGCVQKETSCHTWELRWTLVVHLGKFTSTNTEIRFIRFILSLIYILLCELGQLFSGSNIRYQHTPKSILLIIIVTHRIDKRVYLKLFLPLRRIDDKVRSKQHKVRNLILFRTQSHLIN